MTLHLLHPVLRLVATLGSLCLFLILIYTAGLALWSYYLKTRT